MKFKNTAGRFRFPGMFVIPVLMLMLPGTGLAQEYEGVVETETGIYYTVKEGDTLWDLSRRFSDSPWLWPDMWKDNRHIANPHEIYPGDRIRLYRRKDVEHLLDADALGADGSPGRAPREVYNYPGIDQVGFVRETPVSPVGRIFREFDGLQMIHSGNRIYLQANGDARLAPGGLYTVYRTLEEVRSPLTGASIGVQHLILGVVKVLKEEPRMYVGSVTRSFRAMQAGDLLTPFRKRSEKLPVSRGLVGFSGVIVSPEEDRRLLAYNHIAFIDKGETDGVRPGQIYYAYQEEKPSGRTKKDAEAGFSPTPVKIGEMIVLVAERTTATVLITQSDRKIKSGSKISSAAE